MPSGLGMFKYLGSRRPLIVLDVVMKQTSLIGARLADDSASTERSRHSCAVSASGVLRSFFHRRRRAWLNLRGASEDPRREEASCSCSSPESGLMGGGIGLRSGTGIGLAMCRRPTKMSERSASHGPRQRLAAFARRHHWPPRSTSPVARTRLAKAVHPERALRRTLSRPARPHPPLHHRSRNAATPDGRGATMGAMCIVSRRLRATS